MKVVAAAVVIFCTSNSNSICPAQVLEKFNLLLSMMKDTKSALREVRLTWMVVVLPAVSMMCVCVNSVCILLSALVQKKFRLYRLTADWHE